MLQWHTYHSHIAIWLLGKSHNYSSNSWSITSLPQNFAGYFAATSVGNLAPFVGSQTGVNIYNSSSNSWSFLSAPAGGGVCTSIAATVGNLAVFGLENTLSIYNYSSGVWKSGYVESFLCNSFIEEDLSSTGTSVGDLAFFAGSRSQIISVFATCMLDAPSQECVPCSLGSYSTLVNNFPACPQCAAGTFSNTTSATTCISCPAGTYLGARSSSACTLCAAGTYLSTIGAASREISLLHSEQMWGNP